MASASEPTESGLLQGVGICVGVGLLAVGLDVNPIVSHAGAAIVAMLLGMVLGNVLSEGRLGAGCDWVVRVILPLGIVLLGARIELADLVGLGFWGVGMGVFVIGLLGVLFYGMVRWGGIPPRLAVLLALGNGVCGGSAIAAAAPVLGATRNEVAVSVSAVVIVGTLGTLALPVVGGLLALSPHEFGLWAGLSLQQTPQVIAAGMAYGPEAGAVATAAKLVRISLLVPVIFVLGWSQRDMPHATCNGRLRQLVPNFLWGFVALSVASTLSLLPEIGVRFDPVSWASGWQGQVALRDVATSGSEACMVLVMAAIGLQTRWEALKDVGPRVLAACLVGALVVATTVGLFVAA